MLYGNFGVFIVNNHPRTSDQKQYWKLQKIPYFLPKYREKKFLGFKFLFVRKVIHLPQDLSIVYIPSSWNEQEEGELFHGTHTVTLGPTFS